ncbi:hypothetical protein BDW66DRAFT_142250 [Aspergillus desertorum]
MDAYAYLIRHGWSGPGNPLNPDRAGVRGGLGLTKPLLVARRSGNQGVGNKTTKDPTNQWWLRGFEDALKGIGTPKEDTIIGKGNALTSELYRHFVRGEVVPGTLGGSKDKDGEKEGSKKRKREGDEEGESKKERKLRKEEKRRRKAKKTERKERRKEKKERREKRAVEKAERKERKAKEKKERKIEGKEKKPEDEYPTPVSMDSDSMDTQDWSSSLHTERLKKKEKEKKGKKEEALKESKKDKKRGSSSDESSERKLKRSKTT